MTAMTLDMTAYDHRQNAKPLIENDFPEKFGYALTATHAMTTRR